MKQKYIVTIGGKPAGFSLAGLFGSKRGYLVPSSRPHVFGGEKSATEAVSRLNAARIKVRSSVIHDWVVTQPLFADGDVKVELAQAVTG